MTAAESEPTSDTSSLGSAEEHAAVYAAVVDSALDAVVIVDEDGAVVAINPAAEATFGYSRREAIGRPIDELIVPEHLKSAHANGMARYRATREAHVLGRRVEMDARCKDGRIIPVELAITEVNLPDRRLFTANLRDLSAAKSAAAEIERQRDALHQSEKLTAIGSLLAGVAHELNNPLSVVLGQSIMLREELAAVEGMVAVAERAAKIEAAAVRCARVVRSFLAIARQRKAERKSLDIAPLIDASIELILYGLKSNGIVVTRSIDPSIPNVVADPDQVQNIVVNLLVNSMQALTEVEGHREIAVSARIGGGGTLSIVVADNGPGVPPHIEARIFDPFFTTKPQGVGTGIGLAISRGLAEAQGGRLDLIESPLGGAGFELSLPLADASTAGTGVSDTMTQTAAAPSDGDQRTRRALIIDDEPEIAEVLAEALARVGFACDQAAGGNEAKALIERYDAAYDALVCDLRMPDLDGPALFRWLQAEHPDLARRTMFVTGDALGPAAGRFLAECGQPVLEKPFTLADVTRIVQGFPAYDG